MSLTKNFGRKDLLSFWVHGSVDGLSGDRRRVEIPNEACDQTAGRVSPSGSVSRRKHFSACVCYNHVPVVAVAGNG